jgi:hypothetical protein
MTTTITAQKLVETRFYIPAYSEVKKSRLTAEWAHIKAHTKKPNRPIDNIA